MPEYVHICTHRHIKWMHNKYTTCMHNSSLSNYCICIHIQTHAYMQKHIHAYKCAHACIHACILQGRFGIYFIFHAYIRYTYIHGITCMHMYVCIYIYIYIYIYIQYTFIHEYDTHACMHGKGCLRIYKEHANMHACMHACVHACMHACVFYEEM